jgi:hypothetical protein
VRIDENRKSIAIGLADNVESLEFLSSFQFVESLKIDVDSTIDTAPLVDLPNLRKLEIGSGISISPSMLPRLVSFSGDWSHIVGTFGHDLESINLVNFNATVDCFAACSRLQHLGLARPSLESLHGFRNPHLLSLKISNNRCVLDLCGISGCPNVVEIHVSDSAGIDSIESLVGLHELYELRLNNLRQEVTSLSFISEMNRLQGLRFVGTQITDGDLTYLVNLKWTGFDNKRRYSHRDRDIDAILRSRGGGAVVVPGDYGRHEADIRERRLEVCSKLGIDVSEIWSDKNEPRN